MFCQVCGWSGVSNVGVSEVLHLFQSILFIKVIYTQNIFSFCFSWGRGHKLETYCIVFVKMAVALNKFLHHFV